MNLHVVAYPELSRNDYDLIQSFRKNNNSLYKVIEPHFTIVFSVQDMPVADFISEVEKKTGDSSIIRFCFRCAVINKDSFSDNYDAFLVPDEGYSSIVRLHDKLYSDKLSSYHRMDISYIPHLSIANSPDLALTKAIVDKINEKEFAVHGAISALDIINYENRIVTMVDRINLR